jgi:uncharacterized protein with PIN domain
MLGARSPETLTRAVHHVAMPRIVVEVDASLRGLLPPRGRDRPLVRDVVATETVRHIVQAVGVPVTEVGGVRIDDAMVGRELLARTHLDRPARLVVDPRPRPQPHPGRFLLDVHLGALTRRMRLLGIDVAYDPAADDAELAERSAAEERVLLTRDRALLFRTLIPDGALVRADDVEAQLDDVLDRFAPELAPWTRCLRCGGALVGVPAEAVAAELEPGTRRTYASFSRCADCGQVYWRGAHSRRLGEIVSRAVRGPDADTAP